HPPVSNRIHAFTDPGIQHALNAGASDRIHVLTNPGVWHALNPGAVLVPAHPPGNGILLPPGGGSKPAPVAAGGGSGPTPSATPHGGPGFRGKDVVPVLPTVVTQAVVAANGPSGQPVVARASTAVAPVV